jgi:hypothetical protein
MSFKSQRAILLLAFLLILFPQAQAHADTYELFQFTNHSGAGPVLGIDDAGDVLYGSPTEFCSTKATVCYSVFQPFGPGYNTETLPPLNFDDGSACSPNP